MTHFVLLSLKRKKKNGSSLLFWKTAIGIGQSQRGGGLTSGDTVSVCIMGRINAVRAAIAGMICGSSCGILQEESYARSILVEDGLVRLYTACQE